MEIFITKVIIFFLVFAALDIIREAGVFYNCFRKMETYEISNVRMLGLWASISYVLTIILTGIL